MEINDAKIGIRVNHFKYGNGTITNVTRNITVEFDIEMEGKKVRTFSADALVIAKSEPPKNVKMVSVSKLKKNDAVFSELDGEGIVTETSGFFHCVVKFKNGITKKVLINSLKKIENEEEELFESDENVDELPEFDSFKVYPYNYSTQNCFSTESKEILTWLRKHYENGIAAVESFTVDNEVKTKNSTGFFLIPNKGVVVFKVFDDSDEKELVNSLPVYDVMYSYDKKIMIDRFMDSKILCSFNGNGKIQRFPLKYIYIFQNMTSEKMKYIYKNSDVINKNFFFKYFKSKSEIFSEWEPYDNNFTKIDEGIYANITEKVIPFYSIWNGKDSNVIKASDENKIGEFSKITGKENVYRALNLDDEQINIINNTKQGHWLTLANPGTGKSVILLAKAHRLISQKSTENILITCYNKNLCDTHDWNSIIFGLKTENFWIHTFHNLVFRLLDKYKMWNGRTREEYLENEELFNDAVNRIIYRIDNQQINPFFDAIFIDEVQLIMPLWIKMCYKLLKKDGYFELFGDLNQNVRSIKLKGLASWQDKKILNFNWQGRVRYFERNYRNSIIINEYLKAMINTLNEKLANYGKKFNSEDACLNSNAFRKVNRHVHVFGKSSKELHVRVVNMIKQIKKSYDYSEIAIILPARQLKTINYYPLEELKTALYKGKIPYSVICNDSIQTPISSINGVVLTTIDSALGLDFKAVIFCGTKYFNYYWTGDGKQRVLNEESFSGPNKEVAIDSYCEIGRKIYSACSRAKDVLVILDDLPETSIVKELFLPKEGMKYVKQ